MTQPAINWILTDSQIILTNQQARYSFDLTTQGLASASSSSSARSYSQLEKDAAEQIYNWQKTHAIFKTVLNYPIEGTIQFVGFRWDIKVTEEGSTTSNLDLDACRVPFQQDSGSCKITPRLVGHLFGDSFIRQQYVSGRSLEGMDPIKILQFFKRFILNQKQRIKCSDKAMGLIPIIDQAINFNSMLCTYLEKAKSKKNHRKRYRKEFAKGTCELLKKLKPNENVLISGGWTELNSTGHTVYLFIRRCIDSTYSIEVFNTGEGVNQFHHSLTVNKWENDELVTKVKYQKRIQWNITEAQICNPFVWYIFFEMMEGTNPPPQYDATSWYLAFLKAITPTFGTDPFKPSSELVDAQDSGTCSWKSFVAFLHTVFEKKEWRELKHELRLYTLVNLYFQKLSHPSKEINLDEIFLYQASLDKFARAVEKDYQNKILDIKQAAKNIQLINQLRASLKSFEKTKLPASRLLPDLAEVGEPIRLLSKKDISKFTKFRDVVKDEEIEGISYIPKEKNLRDREDGLCVITLEETILVKVRAALEEDNFKEAFLYISEVLEQLSPPDNDKRVAYWGDFSIDDQERLAKGLAQLAEYFFISMINYEDLGDNVDQIYRFQKLYAIVYQLFIFLSSKKEYEFLKINITPPFLTHDLESLTPTCGYLFLLDPIMEEECVETLKFLQEHNGKTNFFYNNILSTLEELSGEVPNFIEQITDSSCSDHLVIENSALKNYIKTNPKVKKKLTEAAVKFWNLPDSQNIPLHWLVALAKIDLKGEFVPKGYAALKKLYFYFQICVQGFKYEKKTTDYSKFVLEIEKAGKQDIRIKSVLNGVYCKLDKEPYREKLGKGDSTYYNTAINSIYNCNKGPFRAKNDKQNSVLTTVPLEKNQREFFNDLLLIGCPDDGQLQPIKVISYFISNLNKLSDGYAQLFCMSMLFETDILSSLLKDFPEIIKPLREFIFKGLNYFANEDRQFKFFFRIGCAIDAFIQHQQKKYKLIPENVQLCFPDPLHYLREYEKAKIKTNPDTALFCLEYLIYPIKKQLNRQELFIYFRAIIFVNEYETTDMRHEKVEESCYELFCQLVEFHKRDEKEFKRWIKEALDSIIPEIYPDSKLGEIDFSQFPLIKIQSSPENFYFHLSKFELFKGGSRRAKYMPDEFTDKPIFQYGFAVDFESIDNVLLKFRRCTFDDLQRNTNHMYIKKKSAAVEKIVRGKSYWLINKADEEIVFSGKRKNRYAVWQSEDEEPDFLFIDKEAFEVMYNYDSKSGKLSNSEKASRKLFIGQMNDDQFFLDFDSRFDAWLDESHHFKVLSFPTFDLEFICEKDNLFYTEEFPGFFLSNNQYHPYLDRLKGYLILENRKREKKVILSQELKDFPNFHEMDGIKSLRYPGGNYIVFDFKVDDIRLKSNDLEDNFYLSFILLNTKKYELSYSYIIYGCRSKTFSYSNANYLLDKFLRNRDSHPFALAIKLQMASLFLKTIADNRDSVSQEIASVFRDYLKNIKNSGPFRLKKEDELLFYTFLAKDHVLLQRKLSILEPTKQASESTTTLNEKDPSEDLNGDSQLSKLFESPINETDFNLEDDIEYYARINSEEFKLVFKKVYQLAKITNAQDDQLLSLLFLINQDQYKNFIYFLTYVLKDSGTKLMWENLEHYITEKNPIYDVMRNSFAVKMIEGKKIFNQTSHFPSSQIIENIPQPMLIDMSTEIVIPDIASLKWVPLVDKKWIEQIFVKDESIDIFERNKKYSEVIDQLQTAVKKVKDHLLEKAIIKIIKDIEFLMRQPVKEKWILNKKDGKNNLQEVQTILIKQIEEREAYLKKKLLSILQLANKLPEESEERVKRYLKIHGKHYVPFQLKDLLLFYLRKDPSLLTKKNPALNQKDIEAIYNDFHDFVFRQCRQNQTRKILLSIENILSNESENEHELLTNQLYIEMLKESNVDQVKHPEQMIFQYLSGHLLRLDQIASLEKLSQGNIILQRKSGSGKSEIYNTLLALKHADGHYLSIIMVLDELFNDSFDGMFIKSGEFFDQNVETLVWSDTSSQNLEKIYNALEKIRQARNFLIVKSREIRFFALQAKKARLDYASTEHENAETAKRVFWFKRILAVFKKHGYVVFDEVDLLLDSRHENHISYGKRQSLHMSRYDIVFLIYEVLLSEMTSSIKLEFYKNDAPIFSEELFDEIKILFVEKIIDRIGKDENLKEIALDVRTHVLDPNFRKWLIAFLADLPFESENYFEKLSPASQADWLFVREIILTLKLTLNRNFNEHYGFFQILDHFCGPYGAAHKPKLGSEFGNYHELICFTIQGYLSSGIRMGKLEEIIETLKKALVKDEQGTLEEFQRFCPDSSKYQLNKLSKKDFFNLVKNINGEFKRVIYFLRHYILPELTFPTKRISHRPHQLVDLFAVAVGFTATTWNHETYHSKLKVETEEGVDGSTWVSAGNCLEIVESLKPIDILNELDQRQIISKLHAIIDNGAWLKDLSESEIAEKIFSLKGTASKNTYVGYSDCNKIMQKRKENLTNYERNQVNLKKCFTVYTQKHCTGSDIQQAAKAVALLTVNKNTKIRDFQQGAWRLRELDNGQSLVVGVHKELARIIPCLTANDNTLRVLDVMIFTLNNQVKQLSKDIILSFKGAIQNEINQIIEKIFETVPLRRMRKKFFKDLDSLTITDITDLQPTCRNGALLPAFQVLTRYKEMYLKPVLEFVEKYRSKYEKKVKRAVKTLKKLEKEFSLPKKLADPDFDVTMEPEDEDVLMKPTNEIKKLKSKISYFLLNLNYLKLFNPLENRIDQMIVRTVDRVPKLIPLNLDLTKETTMEQTVEIEQEVDVLTVTYDETLQPEYRDNEPLKNMQQIFSLKTFEPKKVYDHNFDKPGYINVAQAQDIFCHAKCLIKQSYVPLGILYPQLKTQFFSSHLLISEAFMYTTMNKSDPFGFFLKPLNTFLVIQDKISEEFKIVLISANEVGRIKNYLAKERLFPWQEKRDCKVCLYNPFINYVVQEGSDPIKQENLENCYDFHLLVTQARFFTGELFYSKLEESILVKWFEELGGIKEVQRFFEKEILAYKKERKENYPRSVIKQVFNKFSNKRKEVSHSSSSSSSSEVFKFPRI